MCSEQNIPLKPIHIPNKEMYFPAVVLAVKGRVSE